MSYRVLTCRCRIGAILVPVRTGSCQFVLVRAGSCQFVPVRAGSCRFVPFCTRSILFVRFILDFADAQITVILCRILLQF